MDRKKGAVLSFRFKETRKSFISKITDDITSIIYESVARKITKKELLELVEGIYKSEF